MRQVERNRTYTKIKTAVDQKSQDAKERINVKERITMQCKTSGEDDSDYWCLITSSEYLEMLSRQQGDGDGFHGPHDHEPYGQHDRDTRNDSDEDTSSQDSQYEDS